MFDTRLTDDAILRSEALLDRVSATPIGRNAHMLRVALAECDALERASRNPSTVCKLRDLRHWLRLAYGNSLHAYPAAQLRRILLDSLTAFGTAFRRDH